MGCSVVEGMRIERGGDPMTTPIALALYVLAVAFLCGLVGMNRREEESLPKLDVSDPSLDRLVAEALRRPARPAPAAADAALPAEGWREKGAA